MTTGRLLGDGLVPLDSALGRHDDPLRTLAFGKDRQWVGYRMGHLDLLHRPEVFVQLQQWLRPAAEPRSRRSFGSANVRP